MFYVHFLIFYPGGATKYTPDYPHIDLLFGVINAGVVPPDIEMKYFAQKTDDNTLPNPFDEYITVPKNIRNDAWEFWTMVK